MALLVVLTAPFVEAVLHHGHKDVDVACQAADLKIRTQVQSALEADCVEMCKAIGAYPKCSQCEGYVADHTPGVMTWPELMTHMNNIMQWGRDEIKSWKKRASSFLQVVAAPVSAMLHVKHSNDNQACQAADLKNRAMFEQALESNCEEMCKAVGAYPKCSQCEGFVPPDSTPGEMTWPEVIAHMDNLVNWGRDQLKSWRKRAGQ